MFCMLKARKYFLTSFQNTPCLAVKKLSALLREIATKNNGDYYCLSFLHLIRTENNSNHTKSVRK